MVSLEFFHDAGVCTSRAEINPPKRVAAKRAFLIRLGCFYRVVDDEICTKISESYHRRITREEMAKVEADMDPVVENVAALLDLDVTQVGWFAFQGS